MLLTLLKELREETIQAAENPQGRDAYAFGEVGGMFRALRAVQDRLEAAINQQNHGEDTE